MLAYTGRAHGTADRADLAALIRESVPFLEIPAGQSGVRLELAADLPPIQADPAQVRQVLVSLVTNAAEASEARAGGVIVSARVAEVTPGAADANFALVPPPGQYVVLTVSDTGTGMTPDVRARMFDPFFTTKFAGRGLGLAAVLGIVRAHEGGIRVQSAPGRGTEVAVYWPVATGPAPAPAAPPLPVPQALIIDDEMYVREVTASALEELGYDPVLAGDGPSGITQFHQHRDSIKVVVIDVMMPGMSGDQVLASLRAIDPDLPAVLISGYTDRRIVKAVFGPRTIFLQKPFHPEELMDVVRRLVPSEGMKG
jgi:CheY-like chemotaxis protein